METCPVCSSSCRHLFDVTVLRKHHSAYFECTRCALVFLPRPHWFEEAYGKAIVDHDTGILVRNQQVASFVALLALRYFARPFRVLDYAGGYGILTRWFRDIGFDSYWTDPLADNILARGFEDHGNSYDFATAIECFEHFDQPLRHFEQIFAKTPNLLISTTLIADPAPRPADWHYYGPEAGQHVSFYRKKTFEHIAEKFNKKLISVGEYHLLAKRNFNESYVRLAYKLSRRLPLYFLAKLRFPTLTFTDNELLRKLDQKHDGLSELGK